ncbi:ABC transporter ATP-binding protein [Salinarimonas soli]|uniref:Dipeptide ABC transporter ATP-binding protein n=1 Tax=Salinarimonas soli TaxID=1638099 RepID=A0A5B2VEX9_9HYPH|nr:dipeptide ABC transporter ATP-binding protein [Salinarimonas soli]KAA2236869.1 dipeptide ABC transporter ATP-binding protein [Salinarimonas soli]
MSGPLLVAEDLVKHFPVGGGLFAKPAGVVKAVDGVSLTLRRGETLALVGESGCGKSTLGRLILRLIEPTAGRVTFDGTDMRALGKGPLRRLRRRMQIVFQDPFASLNPRLSVAQILAEPLELHGLTQGAETDARVRELLGLVGLAPEHGERYPHEFSGGQRQRIGVARALATNPDLIVCDEPVSALDVSIQAQVVNLLQDLQARFGLAYVFIAHDLAVVKHIADRVAVMYLGRIVEIGDKRILYDDPRHPYTQALLSAAPRPDPLLARERIILQGDVPSPLAPPPGCAFHTRCPHARERCRTDVPALRPVGTGREAACHFAEEIAPPQAAGGAARSAAVAERLGVLASRRAALAPIL